MKNKLTLFGLFFTTVIFGFANIAYRFIVSTNYFSVVFFILLFSSVMTLAILAFSKKLKELRSLKKIKFIIIIGITNSVTWFLIYFSCYKHVNSSSCSWFHNVSSFCGNVITLCFEGEH